MRPTTRQLETFSENIQRLTISAKTRITVGFDRDGSMLVYLRDSWMVETIKIDRGGLATSPLASRETPGDRDVARGEQLAREHGW